MRLAQLLEKPKLGSAGTLSGSKLAHRTIALLQKKYLKKLFAIQTREEKITHKNMQPKLNIENLLKFQKIMKILKSILNCTLKFEDMLMDSSILALLLVLIARLKFLRLIKQ